MTLHKLVMPGDLNQYGLLFGEKLPIGEGRS